LLTCLRSQDGGGHILSQKFKRQKGDKKNIICLVKEEHWMVTRAEGFLKNSKNTQSLLYGPDAPRMAARNKFGRAFIF
jgi:hypothetical protein